MSAREATDDDARRSVRRRRQLQGAWYSPIALVRGLIMRPRLYLAGAAAGSVLYFAPDTMNISLRGACAWVAGSAVYIAIAFWLMSHEPEVMRQRAEREDESRFVISILILLAVASSFIAVGHLIVDAKAAEGLLKTVLLTAAGLTVVCSWLIVQIVFTLHYAHDYYRLAQSGEGDARGLQFPGDDQEPDYWDFFYFATSFGAAAQTSDVTITSKPLRRLATWHAILSFAFNTTVLAMAINLTASLLL